MAPLTILTGDDVRTLLLSLTRADVEALHMSLAEALKVYSTGTQDETACSSNQPHRTSIRLKNGSTMLFMPAATCDGAGIKMVNMPESSSNRVGESAGKAAAAGGGGGSGTFGSRVGSTRSTSTSSMDSSMTSVTNSMDDVSIANSMTSIASSQSTSPWGSLTLLDSTGLPRALINAEELTAFRTALAATMLLRRRETVQTITVFGAGKQAYWHIRLSLILRGPDIKRVNIINRSFSRARPLLQEFYSEDANDWRSGTKFSVLSAEYGEYDRVLKEEVRKADVIFCCTPTTTPLFPAEHLTAHEGRKKGRLISAIGSYRADMCELHPDILRQAVAPHHHNHHHKHVANSGVIIVDSLSACLKEAGEIIQAGLGPDQLVEIGELVMLKHVTSHHYRHYLGIYGDHSSAHGGGSGDDDHVSSNSESSSIKSNNGNNGAGVAAGAGKRRHKYIDQKEAAASEEADSLMQWLIKGNVIYNSVGLGLMDVVVGNDLVTLAQDRGIGTVLQDF